MKPTDQDFQTLAEAATSALLRAVKAGGYRAVVRQLALHRQRLDACPEDAGRKALRAVIDKLEALKATMPVPEGYLPGMEG